MEVRKMFVNVGQMWEIIKKNIREGRTPKGRMEGEVRRKNYK